jgi:hypothetical protein
MSTAGKDSQTVTLQMIEKFPHPVLEPSPGGGVIEHD